MGLAVGFNQVQWNALAAGVLCVVMAIIVVIWARSPLPDQDAATGSKYLHYQQQIEHQYRLRISALLSSFLDESDVHIQVKTDLDFSSIPAHIKHLTVVVILDEQRVIQKNHLDQITRLLELTIGIDKARGDHLSLTRLPFQHSAINLISPGLLRQGLASGLLLCLILILKVVVQSGLGVTNRIIGESVPEPVETVAAISTDPQRLAREMADQDPKHVAQVIKLWMSKDV